METGLFSEIDGAGTRQSKSKKREFLLLLMLPEADNHPNDEGDVENGDDQHEGGQHLDGGGDGIALKKKEPSAEEEQNDGNGHRDGAHQNIGKTQTRTHGRISFLLKKRISTHLDGKKRGNISISFYYIGSL